MTVNRLKKELEKLIVAGHGRATVCVNKNAVTHPLEPDGCCIIPVTSVTIQTHELMDADGGSKVLANGCIAVRTSLVIAAEC